MLTALVQVFGLRPFRARLRDVSSGGCKIVTGMALRPDEIVLITLPTVGETEAYVVWSARGYCGLRFRRPLDTDRVIGRTAPTPGVRTVSLAQWNPGAR